MDRAVTGKAFVLYLTYGSRTVNRTDSLYQTINELVGNVDCGESLTVVAYEFLGLNTRMTLLRVIATRTIPCYLPHFPCLRSLSLHQHG